MQELKGAILSQNHWRSQGGDPLTQGARAPSIEMPPMTKFDKKALFLDFQFLLASLLATVHAHNST